MEKKLGVISGLGLKWWGLGLAGSLLNVLTLTPNPGNTIRASRLASNCNGGFQPATGRMEKGKQEFLGARLLQIIEGCSSKASGESAAILATVGSSSISLCKNQ